jgi:DNA-binding beta-propeller fold protein YncE
MIRAGPLAALMVALILPAAATAAVPPSPPGSIAVPGGPTGLVAFAGGDRIVAGFEGRFGINGGLALFRRAGKTYALEASAHTAAPVESVALSPDGRTVVAATKLGLAAVDLAALAGGKPKLDELRIGPAPDANQIAFARSGAYVFFTVQRYAELDVARVGGAEAGGAPELQVVAKVPLDRSPGGLALSPDGTTLYVTSEIDNADPKTVPGASDPQLGREKCAFNLAPSGVLSAVDTAKAIADPAHAVVARIAAGCAPTRVALTPDGSVAWVSVRGENRVIALDTARLRGDPAHAFLASVGVDAVPVGLAVSADGRTLLVANSHRSRDADQARAANLSVIDTAAALAGKPAVVATLPTGALAREVVAGPDGDFYVTNFLSKSIAIVSAAALRPGRHASWANRERATVASARGSRRAT